MNGYERISKYKSHLMGLAILVVVYGHTLYYKSGLQNYEDLHFTIWYTLGSVEMFMFVSGFGIFQSLRKNRDAYTFYGRRLQRLAPSYLPVIAVWVIYSMIFNDMRVGEAVGNLTSFGWWGVLDQQFNWYVPATVILYLLSPLFYDCLTKWKRPWFGVVLLFVLIVSLWRSNILMAVSRFPTYYLGMYFGMLYAEKQTPSKKMIIGWSIAAVLAMAVVPYYFIYRKNTLWYYGMYWILFFFSTPTCMFGVTKLLEWQDKCKVTRLWNRLIEFLGNRSFEIYLVHLAFFYVMLDMGFRTWKAWIVFAFVGITLGCIYNYLVNLVLSRVKKKQKI